MVTPFDEQLNICYSAVEQQVEWYIQRGTSGIFVVCQSSEMEQLNRGERQALSRAVVKAVNGRVPVVASGHLSETPEEQYADVMSIYETGVDSVVLVSNRFASDGESEDVFIGSMDRFLNRIDTSVQLGMYECPSPYKWLLTDRAFQYCINSGRIDYFKDTSCDTGVIKKRAAMASGSSLYILNANTATFLQGLKDGADGYSGVMANFHPELYRWLFDNYETQPALALRVSDFLSAVAAVECRNYPDCAKYHLSKYIKEMQVFSRRDRRSGLPQAMQMEIDAVERLADRFREECGIRI